MLSVCANTGCSAGFRYLRQGKLFAFYTESNGALVQSARPEFFWLCADCASRFTLILEEKSHVTCVPLRLSPTQDGAKSTYLAAANERAA